MEPDYHEIKSLCFGDAQQRYEAIRPLLFNSEYGVRLRSQETYIAERTLHKYLKAFKDNGFEGLQDSRESPWNKGQRHIPEEICAIICRLRARSPNISVFEIQKYISSELNKSINYKTLQKWVESIAPEAYLSNLVERPESSYEKKVEAVKLRKKGLSLKTISQWVGSSVSTVKRALFQFNQTKSFAALEPRHKEAVIPKRIFNFNNLNTVMRLQKKYPKMGSWRLSEMLRKDGMDWGRSTVAKMMAFNRTHYLNPPEKKQYKANIPRPVHRHQYWYVDIRYLTVYERQKAYSICILEGYSRKILAGEATNRQNLLTLFKVLYPAVKEYGVPHYFVSDNAKIFRCPSFLNFLSLLAINPHPIDKGKPWQNLIESFFGIEQRILDPIASQAQNFPELQILHRDFLDYYNHSSHYAHQNRLDKRQSPHDVLSWVKGRTVGASALSQVFQGLVIERKLTKSGYTRVHNFYLYVCLGHQGKVIKIVISETNLKIEMDGQLVVTFDCELFSNQELKKVFAPKYLSHSEHQKQLSLFEPSDPVWPSHFKGRRKKHIPKENLEMASKQLKIPFEDLEGWEAS